MKDIEPGRVHAEPRPEACRPNATPAPFQPIGAVIARIVERMLANAKAKEAA